LRELFASNDKQLSEKDIIFTITPHILRTPNITAEDLAPIWIGTEDDIRLKNAPPISVFERSAHKKEQSIEDLIKGDQSKEKAPVTTPHPAPETRPVEPEPQNLQPQPENIPLAEAKPPEPSVVTPVEPAPAPTANTDQDNTEASSVALSFLSPNVNPKMEQDVILHLRADNASQLANAFLFLEFDPSAVQIKDITQGALMTPGAFVKSFDNSRGTININTTHVPSSSTESGIIATIVLQLLKPGQTTMRLNSAVLRSENASVLPVTFVPYTFTVE